MNVIQESWGEECIGDPAFCFSSKLKRQKIILKKRNWEVFGDLRIKVKATEEKVLAASLESDEDPENIDFLNKLVTTRDILVNHYKKKFERKNVIYDDDIFELIPKILTDEDNKVMDVVPSFEEFKNAVFGMNANSASGPDGFPGSFYKYAWKVIGSELMEAMQYCWHNRYIPRGFNSNLLFLVPKIQGAKRAEYFRPIGLANFNFKIITRIITDRISKVIGRLISEQQGAFIKGRNIHEKIVLASELVNELNCKRRGGNVRLKIDITQAYDSLSWDFLFEVLRRFGFSDLGIQWLNKIFESARISVLVNGGPCGFFDVGRGDPTVKKLITIKWDKVNAPVVEGGLGLRRLEVMNKALLMKLL
ncbi:uncharacterized protein LOC113312622 [Papaver somniferum]|uniref:uncharacterized protein LOC113312622 n=1 Tax=Papaver somniferum TaxID=3469 RepID=UPI000E702BE3|nr:uncharacterized protein LOC113312622 [Papaver somniferum]